MRRGSSHDETLFAQPWFSSMPGWPVNHCRLLTTWKFMSGTKGPLSNNRRSLSVFSEQILDTAEQSP